MPDIYITGITFRNHQDLLDLSTPKFPNLINYDLVTPAVRAKLQIEPAFQFVTPPDSEPYRVHFELDEPGIVFTTEGEGPRMSLVPDDKSLIAGVELSNNKTSCKVTIYPLNWPEPVRVVTLRLYCSEKEEPKNSHSYHGVNLVLLKPGGKEATNIQSPILTKTSDFTIKVTELHEDPVFPKYHIFNYDPPLPYGISLEPVFRLSNARPTANVAIELAPNLGKVFKMDGDDVRVLMRNPPWPDTLSKVEGGDQAVAFSAESAVEKAGETIRTFSFLMELADPAPPMLTIASSTPSLAASNTGPDARSCSTSRPPSHPPRPRPSRWPKVHVDPVMIHEPLPTGIP